ncbi:MAG: glycosyltransferase family 4 protein [Calditrichaeota bacterium]|nr:glycosyltransferase family 4 protein [Calditrichota bacterium]
MKKLLIISTNFPPSISIGTQRILRICKFLDPVNWGVSILTLKENYYPDLSHRTDDDKDELLAKLKIHRTGKVDPVFYLLNLRESLRGKSNGAINANGAAKPRPKPKQDPGSEGAQDYSDKIKQKKSLWQQIKDFFTDIMQFPDKNITWLPLAVWRGYRVIRKQKIDVIFSSSPPHSLHLISAILKRLTGRKLVVDFRDPWARSPWHDEERELNRFEQWKHQRIVKFEDWVVRTADKVILVTREMREDYVKAYPHLPAEKFIWFSNGYDPDQVQPLLQPNGRDIQPEKVKFIHAGSLYKYRNPTPIIHALKHLVDKNQIDRNGIEFLFIGGITPDQAHTPGLVKEMGIDDIVKFMPPVSYNTVMQYMLESHVLILLQPVTQLQLPGKFFDYLCLQKPILAVAEKNSSTEHMVGSDFGVFADFNDVADVEKAIAFLYHHPYFNSEVIREKREAYNMAKSIRQFEKIIK